MKTCQIARMVQLWGISSFFSLFLKLYLEHFFSLGFGVFPNFYFLETFLSLCRELSLKPLLSSFEALLFLFAYPFFGLFFHLKLSVGDENNCIWSPYIFFCMRNSELSLHLTNPLCFKRELSYVVAPNTYHEPKFFGHNPNHYYVKPISFLIVDKCGSNESYIIVFRFWS